MVRRRKPGRPSDESKNDLKGLTGSDALAARQKRDAVRQRRSDSRPVRATDWRTPESDRTQGSGITA